MFRTDSRKPADKVSLAFFIFYKLANFSFMRYYLLAFVLVSFAACQSPTPKEGPIHLLFLGHDGDHHNGKVYMPILASHLAPKGIQLTWASSPEVLNARELGKYQGLILYANHDSITPAQERALLSFVKRGKAFIPLHSASYCFRNSDRFVELVGAQFKSHGVDSFLTEYTQPDHQILESLEPFSTWDETYVHHLHSDDRDILMVRQEGDHREPWTWTRRYGKGRVFYTAYGHDERTWRHPGFLELVEKGILWALGPEHEKQLAQISLPTLTYEESPHIPNYERRPKPLPLQMPLSPENSMKMVQLPQDFTLNLFASEPAIINPIAMSWDERGRLWVLETKDYPNVVRPAEEGGKDVLKILEDRDGDGRADTVKIFADSLNIPTGLVFANGGVIVSQAPDFLFLKDTDGDDKADVREVLFTGWGTYDTHAGPSNLMYGFDNWIWGTVGYSGFEGKVGEKEHKFSMGVYRFKSDGSELEYLTGFTNNTWGLGFNEEFDVFGSTANNEHCVQVAIPDRYFEGVEGIRKVGRLKIDGHYGARPITQNIRQVDVHMGFTAAAGIHLYTARNFPEEYWNRIAFVNAPTLHLLHRAILEREGSLYQEQDGFNMLASMDEWVSPVHAEVGPDGSLWVADWYNFIVQHNPTPKGFENGKGNAHINPLRDKQHGRIYRITYNQSKEGILPDLSRGPSSWVEALGHDNMFWRMQGQRLIVENQAMEVIPDLLAYISRNKVDAIGLNSPAVHAIWTLEGLGAIGNGNSQVDQAIEKALQHPAAGVRKAAVSILPSNQENLEKLQQAGVFGDRDMRVVLAGILFLADLPSSPELGAFVAELSKDERIYSDYWCSKALYAIAGRHRYVTQPEFLTQVDASQLSNLRTPWFEQETSGWDTVHIPQPWGQSTRAELQKMDGIVWMQKDVTLTAQEARAGAKIHLGPIDDSDSVRINGKLVGTLMRGWVGPEHAYDIPPSALQEGVNTISLWHRDRRGRGGLLGEPNQYHLQTSQRKIGLSGSWKYKVAENYLDLNSQFDHSQALALHFLKSYQQEDFLVEDAEEEAPDRRIYLKTVRDKMRYDLETFTVQAGESIEILFENRDGMQHNFLLIEEGRLDEVGAAADLMATSPDGAELSYIPDSPSIIYASTLVDPGQTVRLRFRAPETPGVYPYVCTFPGHWRLMNGVMRVLPKESS